MAETDGRRRRRRRRKPKQRAGLPRAYVLIGMPGSGKSALGRRVARLLGWDFIDTDDVLASRAGMTVGELSASVSNEEFKRLEEESVLSIPRGKKIIATGGSVVYGKRAMHHLKQIGTIIYLDLPLWMLIRRIGDTTQKRGVILKPGQTIGDIYHERKGLYKRYADIEFQTFKLSPGKSSRLLANVIRFMEDDGSSSPGAKTKEKTKEAKDGK